MQNNTNKFLEFNGTRIFFLSSEGVWWIAIKPICEALGVDYERQRRNISGDQILKQLPSEQTVVAADNKLRKMLCLPEFFIYGWLFSIQSKSQQLQQYKWKCYELLYNHFHGSLTANVKLIKQKSEAELEIEKLEKKLSENPEYQQLQELKNLSKKSTKAIIKNFQKQMQMELSFV